MKHEFISILKQTKLAWLVAFGMLITFQILSWGAYNTNVYNSCFQNIFSLALCPLNVVIYLPFIVEACTFIVVSRRIRPTSYSLSFLSAAIISYLFFILILSATGSITSPGSLLYFATSILLTACWIGMFAYELNR